MSLLAVIYLARVLGVQAYGVFEFGLTLLTYATLIATFGLERWATREVAGGEAPMTVVRRVLPARLLTTLIAVPLLLLASTIPGFAGIAPLVAILAVGLLASVVDLRWVFAGERRMVAVGGGLALSGALFLLGVVVTVRSGADLLVAAAWRTGGEVAMVLLWLLLFARRHGVPRSPWSPLSPVLRGSTPMAVTLGLAMLSFSFDSLLIGLMLGAGPVGLYAAAYRLVSVPLAVGAAYFTGLYPHLTAAHRESPDAFRASVRHSIRLTWSLALGGAAVGWIVAGPALDLIYGGDYAAAVPALRILIVSAAASLMRSTWGWALNAVNLTHLEASSGTAATVTNVVLNLILIPTYGLVGAAVATLTSETLWLLMAGRYYRRRLGAS